MTTQDENLLTSTREQDGETTGTAQTPNRSLPIGYVPTPTREYRAYRKSKKAALGAGIPIPPTPTPIPIPLPLVLGSRVLESLVESRSVS